MTRTKARWASLALLAPVALVVACGPATSQHPAYAASTAYTASAAATSTAVHADASAAASDAATLVKPCLPGNLTDLLTKSGRDTFGQCLAIPKANRKAFGDALLTAALSGQLKTKTGRDTFANVTVVNLVIKYRKVSQP